MGLEVFPDPGGSEGRRVREEPLERESTAGSDRAERGARKEEPARETMFVFVLSEALPVVPAKLVRRILKAEYVDMSELLKDNMEAERRRGQADGVALLRTSGKKRSRGPRHLELAAVLCSGGYLTVPREDEGAAGLPDADHLRGQEVWRQRLGDVAMTRHFASRLSPLRRSTSRGLTSRSTRLPFWHMGGPGRSSVRTV